MRLVPLSLGSMLVAVSCAPPAPPPSAPHPMLGHALAVSLPTDGGQLARVPSPDRRPTVLDFWAPTCAPCRQRLPEFVARRGEIEAAGATLVLVAILADDESTERARTTLNSWGVDYPFLVDRGDVSRTQLGVTALPATLVADRSGKLTWVAPPNATVDTVISAIPARR